MCISVQLVLAEGPRANSVRPGGLPLHSQGAGHTASSGSLPEKDETQFRFSLKGLWFPHQHWEPGRSEGQGFDSVDLPSTLNVETPSGAGSSECEVLVDS